jgi:hypothetical protein
VPWKNGRSLTHILTLDAQAAIVGAPIGRPWQGARDHAHHVERFHQSEKAGLHIFRPNLSKLPTFHYPLRHEGNVVFQRRGRSSPAEQAPDVRSDAIRPYL